jgi:hypothetical protein
VKRKSKESSSSQVEKARQWLREIDTELPKVTGYLPLPNAVDELCGRVVEAYVGASDSERASMRSAGPPETMRIFLTYADRMAVVAVRKQSETLIFYALVGLCIEDCGWDERETLLRLSLVHHSARKLGLDAVVTFDSASQTSTPKMGKLLLRFARSPTSIAAMGYCESMGDDGFDYDRNW